MKAGNVTDGFSGELRIDRANGVIEFYTWEGQVRLLRITHLSDPIPVGTSIDLVALPALTSYTPAQPVPPTATITHEEAPPLGPDRRIKDAPQA